MKPEPIEFIQDSGGNWHFAHVARPLKVIFNIHELAFRWITPDETRGRIVIDLDDCEVIYDRVTTGPHGEWICALRIGKPSDDDGDT